MTFMLTGKDRLSQTDALPKKHQYTNFESSDRTILDNWDHTNLENPVQTKLENWYETNFENHAHANFDDSDFIILRFLFIQI